MKLFRDFALPSILPLVKRRPLKRHAALRVLYAFSVPSPTGHLQAIRTLQDFLQDMTSFLHCLTVLIFSEDAFNVRVLVWCVCVCPCVCVCVCV